jgi:hypothetical protein
VSDVVSNKTGSYPFTQNILQAQVMFKLTIPYQQLSGKMNLREVPCLNSCEFDAHKNLLKEVSGPEALQQPSVQKSPSVVPC